MSTRGVPLIDISSFYTGDEADKRRLAKDVGDACERIGFLVITGHKVPPEAIEALTTQSRAFFDLPVELKCNSAPDVQQVFRGYSPLSKESLAALSSDGEAAPPDIKESFDIGPFRADPAKVAPEYADNYYDNIWPEEPSGFRSAAERYFDELEALADDLLAILAGALDLPDDYFSSFTRDHLGLSDLRLINYPEMPDEVAPGQIRGGAHTDYTTITICAVDDAPGGLEVLTPAGEWEAVPYVEGAFVVNIGDVMARWSNDRWISTAHRVANPPGTAVGPTRRQSLIFFHGVRPDAVIECLPNCTHGTSPPKYEPISYTEYMRSRIATQTAINA